MKIIYIRERTYCTAENGFSYDVFNTKLEATLHMRKDSFAERYSQKIFHTLFQSAVDLRQEYLDYYAEEYETFEYFLYQKKLLEKEDIQELALAENQTVLELTPTRYSYNISILLEYEESGIAILNRMLEDISS